MARETGVAWVGVRRSNHAGPAGLYAEMPTAHGMIGIYAAVANANHMATWGGADLLLGTNPLAIGVPSGGGPLVLDMATSIVAYGTVKKYALRGLTMPEGWFVNPETGAPITDPEPLRRRHVAADGRIQRQRPGADDRAPWPACSTAPPSAATSSTSMPTTTARPIPDISWCAIDIARFLPLATFTAEVDRHVARSSRLEAFARRRRHPPARRPPRAMPRRTLARRRADRRARFSLNSTSLPRS